MMAGKAVGGAISHHVIFTTIIVPFRVFVLLFLGIILGKVWEREWVGARRNIDFIHSHHARWLEALGEGLNTKNTDN